MSKHSLIHSLLSADLVHPTLSKTLLIIAEGSSDSVSCTDKNPDGFGGILMWLDPQGKTAAAQTGITSTIILSFKQVARNEEGIYQCIYTRNGRKVTSTLNVVVECNYVKVSNLISHSPFYRSYWGIYRWTFFSRIRPKGNSHAHL